MERGYLVAALAIIATFTGLSSGFRSVEQWSLIHLRHFRASSQAHCNASAPARAAAKIKTRLRPRYAEEAQLLAEMNLPVAEMQARMAEQIARHDTALAQCARARAMRQAEHLQRDMMRMQLDMQRASAQVRIEPMALQIQLPVDLNERIRKETATAVRVATRITCNSSSDKSDNEQ